MKKQSSKQQILVSRYLSGLGLRILKKLNFSRFQISQA